MDPQMGWDNRCQRCAEMHSRYLTAENRARLEKKHSFTNFAYGLTLFLGWIWFLLGFVYCIHCVDLEHNVITPWPQILATVTGGSLLWYIAFGPLRRRRHRLQDEMTAPLAKILIEDRPVPIVHVHDASGTLDTHNGTISFDAYPAPVACRPFMLKVSWEDDGEVGLYEIDSSTNTLEESEAVDGMKWSCKLHSRQLQFNSYHSKDQLTFELTAVPRIFGIIEFMKVYDRTSKLFACILQSGNPLDEPWRRQTYAQRFLTHIMIFVNGRKPHDLHGRTVHDLIAILQKVVERDQLTDLRAHMLALNTEMEDVIAADPSNQVGPTT